MVNKARPRSHAQTRVAAEKLAIERALAAYHPAYGLRYAALRYFNAAGAEASAGLGERHERLSGLFHWALLAVGAIAGVLMMMAASITLLPALLAIVGTRVNQTTRAALASPRRTSRGSALRWPLPTPTTPTVRMRAPRGGS